tara:strand:- start:66 stop:599 length:534 start_codon:yes stop_codon:yes gene_type:complete
MPNFSSSKRFAQAIYAIAKENNTVDDWIKNLESINDILSEKDLVSILNSPDKPIALKCSILDKIYGKSLDRLVLNLLYLLSTRNSIDLISGIKSDFEDMVDFDNGIQKVTVKTATSIDSDHLSEIKNILENISGKKANISIEVDENIIGGFKAIMGDKLIDASLSNSINQMRKTLKF